MAPESPHKTIRKLLIDKEMTVSELARRVGRSVPSVSVALSGYYSMRPTRRLIARALGFRYYELWTDEHPKSTRSRRSRPRRKAA